MYCGGVGGGGGVDGGVVWGVVWDFEVSIGRTFEIHLPRGKHPCLGIAV